MVLEKIFNVMYNCKVMRANDQRDVAILCHMGMLCGTYVKRHVTMLHTKYRSFGSCGFREDFSCISHCKPMADNDALGRSLYGPKGHG